MKIHKNTQTFTINWGIKLLNLFISLALLLSIGLNVFLYLNIVEDKDNTDDTTKESFQAQPIEEKIVIPISYAVYPDNKVYHEIEHINEYDSIIMTSIRELKIKNLDSSKTKIIDLGDASIKLREILYDVEDKVFYRIDIPPMGCHDKESCEYMSRAVTLASEYAGVWVYNSKLDETKRIIDLGYDNNRVWYTEEINTINIDGNTFIQYSDEDLKNGQKKWFLLSTSNYQVIEIDNQITKEYLDRAYVP